MSNLKKLFYMLYSVHIPRNFIQYFVSIIVFYVFFGEISLWKAIVGGLAFILSYQFAYALNDLVDYKHDVKDKQLVEKKQALNYPLHSGITNKQELLIFSGIVFLLGIFLGVLINPAFLFIQMSLFLFIFLHSNPFFRMKSLGLLPYLNMIIIQFIKFSLGWFSQTASLENFPYWFILLLSLVYVAGYRYYKSHFLVNLKFTKMIDIFLIAALFVSYAFSIILYELAFSLIFTVICGLALYLFYFERLKNLKEKMQKGIFIVELFYLALVVSLVLIKLNPVVASVNSSLVEILESNPAIYSFKNYFYLGLR